MVDNFEMINYHIVPNSSLESFRALIWFWVSDIQGWKFMLEIEAQSVSVKLEVRVSPFFSKLKFEGEV